MNEVAIVLVNFNGSDDTIECIQSLLKNNYSNFKIIIVDNNSDENNKAKIKNWFAGMYRPEFKSPEIIFENKNNDISFPVSYYEIDHTSKNKFDQTEFELKTIQQKIILINNFSNQGFAAANNIGMKLSIELNCQYIWLLNNDTVIDKNALTKLVSFANEITQQEKKSIIFGSKVLHYDRPEFIQSLGGKFNPYTFKNFHFGLNQSEKNYLEEPKKIDYPYGAAIFIQSNFIEQVGWMQEDYFLYYEELDWVTRAKRLGYQVRICMNSKVYHKQGKSTGKKMNKHPDPFIACLYYRNLLRYYKRFYWWIYPLAFIRLLLKSLKCFLNGRKEEGKMILKIISGFQNCNVYRNNSKTNFSD